MKKRMKASLALLLVCGVALVGCGTDNNGHSAPNAPAPNQGGNASQDQQEGEAKKQPAKIQVAYYSDELARETFGAIIDRFMELNDHITVENVGTDWGTHYTNLKVDLASGQGPTVYLLDGPYIPQYAQEGAIEDLTDRLQEVAVDDYYGFDSIRNPEGRYYAVPQAIQVNALYYNKTMFDAANVEYPTADWTTDDVLAAARKLTDPGKKQFGMGMANHFRYGWYTAIRQYGGDLLDATRTQSTFASDPNVRMALEHMKQYWDENLTPNLTQQEGEITPNHGSWFSRGIVAMFYDNFARRLTNDAENIDYDVALMPKGANEAGVRYSAFVANSWVLNAQASAAEKEAGWEFIKFFLSEEAQAMNASLAEGITASKAAAQAAFASHTGKPEHITAFLDNMQYAGDIGDSPVWEEWIGAIDPLITDYLAGKLTLDQLLEQGDKAAQAVLNKIAP